MALSTLGLPSPCVAGFQLLEDVIRDGLPLGNAVFNGEARDIPDFHGAGGKVVFQEKFQHPPGFPGNDGADAVAAAHADDQGTQRGVVHKVPLGLHIFHPVELLFQQGTEVGAGPVQSLGIVTHLLYLPRLWFERENPSRF